MEQLVKQHQLFFKSLPDKYMKAVTAYTLQYGLALSLNIAIQTGKPITDPETIDILIMYLIKYHHLTSLTVYRGINAESYPTK
jgi:hypothetical protein